MRMYSSEMEKFSSASKTIAVLMSREDLITKKGTIIQEYCLLYQYNASTVINNK